jgi:hypothetical protein
LVILRRCPSVVALTGSFSAATKNVDRFLPFGPRWLPDLPEAPALERLFIADLVITLLLGHAVPAFPGMCGAGFVRSNFKCRHHPPSSGVLIRRKAALALRVELDGVVSRRWRR